MGGAPHRHEGDTGRFEALDPLVLERNLEQYDPVDPLLLDKALEDLALLERG